MKGFKSVISPHLNLPYERRRGRYRMVVGKILQSKNFKRKKQNKLVLYTELIQI
jgi:hypothetical protein